MFKGLYIHIPFCIQKCRYCDFLSFKLNKEKQALYFNMLKKELRLLKGQTGKNCLSSIYVGGGTPSLAAAEEIASLLMEADKLFGFKENAEITMEANPGTFDKDYLKKVKSAGINRISFGVQSFLDDELVAAGRIHNAEAGRKAVLDAYDIGLENISIDLIQGLPGQNAEDFIYSLGEAVKLPIRHLSVYGLKIEEGTEFYRLELEGKLELPSEEEDEEKDNIKDRFLMEHGFGQYEISNYCRPGYESRHNLLYWHNENYLGAGLGACSKYPGLRAFNTKNLEEYFERLDKDRSPISHIEFLNKKEEMEEEIFLALRLNEGLFLSKFKEKFGIDFLRIYNKEVAALLKDAFLEKDGTSIRLTERGRKFSNLVMSHFVS